METNEDHISRLESEIRYLKGLLDENGIPYDYEAQWSCGYVPPSMGAGDGMNEKRADSFMVCQSPRCV